MTGQWLSIDAAREYDWDCAEIRRMQRTEEETAALYLRLARQRIRAILGRLSRFTVDTP